MRRLVNEAQLAQLGIGLGRSLKPGAVVWLEGEMGAGKTTLVRSLVSGLGVTSDVTSPTYGLVHRYEGAQGPIYHVDCYRLSRPEESRDVDWDSLLQGQALLVEWPERAAGWIPAATHRLLLEYADDPDSRWISDL
ncbi:MAG: tRNA (adenosine(37)-N6)-threonylcarbamoyltransferase complex ATPase subunit type 1 TsaE [Gemmatimonadales bacterium]